MTNKLIEFWGMAVLWAIYLGLTTMAFIRIGITPFNFSQGFLGWIFLIELPRAVIGFKLVDYVYSKIEEKLS